MAKKQKSAKFSILKILSLVCLVVIIGSGLFPWITVDRSVTDALTGEFSAITEAVTDEQLDLMQDMFDEQGIDYDLKGFMHSIETLMDPIADGDVSPMDFIALDANFKEFKGYIIDASELEGDMALELDDMSKQMLDTISTVMLVPVAIYGLLALAAVVRLILRLFNRRGLGVLISLLTIVNVAFMGLLSAVLNAMGGATAFAVSFTPVPIAALVCSILGCIFWGIARKELNADAVQEEVVAPVAQEVVEEVVEESAE